MFYFENRQLKKEIKDLDLKVRVAESRQQEAEYKSRRLESDMTDLGRKLDTANKSLEKHKRLVREQSAADLLVNALKALGVIPIPSGPSNDHFAEQDRLRKQMADAATRNVASGNFGQAGLNQLGDIGGCYR